MEAASVLNEEEMREDIKWGREKERISLHLLSFDPLLFFFHSVEVVNGFLLGDLPQCVNASVGWIESLFSISLYLSHSKTPIPHLSCIRPFVFPLRRVPVRAKASFYLLRLLSVPSRAIVSISGNRFRYSRKRLRQVSFMRYIGRSRVRSRTHKKIREIERYIYRCKRLCRICV